MPVIDADAHVIETERTWEFIERPEQRPLLVGTAGRPNSESWLVDGRLRRRALLMRGPQAAVTTAVGRRARNVETPDPGSGFGMFRAMTAVACHSYILSEIPRRFPDLRWGFIEASAQWIPWVAHEAATRSAAISAKEIFEDLPVYVTCQTDDDLPYILEYAGEDTLVIGTDYGHTDASSEVDAIAILKQRTDINEQVLHKILDENPRRLYGL